MDLQDVLEKFPPAERRRGGRTILPGTFDSFTPIMPSLRTPSLRGEGHLRIPKNGKPQVRLLVESEIQNGIPLGFARDRDGRRCWSGGHLNLMFARRQCHRHHIYRAGEHFPVPQVGLR